VVVAVGAVAATAHGGYEVAVASGVPSGFVSALYPIITDGLALVAYAATHRLSGPARRYAWSVVVVAAALSGLAQAVYLVTGPGLVAPAGMRFGVGAWPAVAGAIAAHLVYLLAAQPVAVTATAAVPEVSPVPEEPTPAPATSPPPKTATPVTDDLDTARRAREAARKRAQRAAARERKKTQDG
jgi:hypothetical protein